MLILLGVVSKMTGKNDKELIKLYFQWGTYRGYSLSKLAQLIGKTRGWATHASRGRTHSLKTLTRQRILEVMPSGEAGDDAI